MYKVPGHILESIPRDSEIEYAYVILGSNPGHPVQHTLHSKYNPTPLLPRQLQLVIRVKDDPSCCMTRPRRIMPKQLSCLCLTPVRLGLLGPPILNP